MPAKIAHVEITTMEAELKFQLQTHATGKQLFDQVVNTIGLREIWYFGLQYKDVHGQLSWLKLNKAVKDQDVPKENVKFDFRAKFFPEDVTDELIQDITVRLFYLQVKEAILKDEIYCPPETAVLLASYAMQAKHSDYSIDMLDTITADISNGRVLPGRVRDQHGYTPEEWAKKIAPWHQEHKGMFAEEAMREYLKIAQDLDMYGVTYFEIKNKKGSELFLGVDALGINVYEAKNKLTPKIGFPWSEISNISFSSKNFKIKPVDKKSSDFVLRVEKMKTNKKILVIAMGNHELYMRRRKPDTIEVQQMKAQAKEDRIKREAEREKLESERKNLKEMERKNQELEDKLKLFKQVADERESKLKVIESENENLRTNLNSVQRDISHIQSEKASLSEEMANLKSELERGIMDRDEYAREISRKQEEFEHLQRDLNEKVEEAGKLKSTLTLTVEQKENEVLRVKQELEAERARAEAAILASQQIHDSNDDKENVEVEMSMDGVTGLNSELDRQTAVDKNRSLSSKLSQLSKELEDTRDTQKMTPLDQYHLRNVKEGNNKYKTLCLIRKGNTKKRVDQFEQL